MPLSSIEAANKEMKSIILESSKNDAASTTALTAAMKRDLYVKFSQQARSLWQSMHWNMVWHAAAHQMHNNNHVIELIINCAL